MMILGWTAAGVLEAERHFRKVADRGHRRGQGSGRYGAAGRQLRQHRQRFARAGRGGRHHRNPPLPLSATGPVHW